MIERIKDLLGKSYFKFSGTKVFLKLKRYKHLVKLKHKLNNLLLNTFFAKKVELHEDRIFIEMFRLIGESIKATSIVETGTFLGFSTRLLAKMFPETKIYTCEVVKRNYLKAKNNLSKFSNVKVYNENSPRFLANIINKGALGERPIFFLDAHWRDEWPLKDELKIISTKLKSAVIIIDDFKVPNNSEFLFDRYGGIECSLDLVILNIDKKNNYNLFFPNYSKEMAFKKDALYADLCLAGYVFIFQNMPSFFRELKNKDFVKKYFLGEKLFN